MIRFKLSKFQEGIWGIVIIVAVELLMLAELVIIIANEGGWTTLR